MKTQLQLKNAMMAIILFIAGTSLSAQVDHFQLGFGGQLPPGWVGDGIYMTSTESNRNVDYEETFGGTHAVKMLLPCEITTKGYYTAGTLSFWIYEKNDGEGYVKVEKSTDGTTWMLVDSLVYTSTSPYTQHTYEINDDSPSVQFRFSSALKEFYMDDASLTSMPPSDNNAFLYNLGVNGTYFPEFETAKLQYVSEITYPTATIEAVTFNPEATYTVDLPDPAEYFGSEAERTANVSVTSKDGSTTETYEIVFNVSGYHIKYGFPFTGGNKAAEGWEATGTYITNSTSNDLYEGGNALRFTTLDGTIHSSLYNGVDTISFFTKVGMNDDSEIQSGEQLLVSAKAKEDILWTDLGTLTTGTDITADWQKVEYLLDSEKDSIQVRWQVTSTNDQTRIYVDDIGISGHPTFTDPEYYTGIENKIPAAKLLGVYPNPASGVLYVQLPENTYEGQLKVHSLTGQLVKSVYLTQNIQQLDVSELTKGTYIVSCKSNGQLFRNKLMVQ